MLCVADGWGSISTEDADAACRQATASPWSLQDGLSQHPLHEAAAHACHQPGIGHMHVAGCHPSVLVFKLKTVLSLGYQILIALHHWLSIWLMCLLHELVVCLTACLGIQSPQSKFDDLYAFLRSCVVQDFDSAALKHKKHWNSFKTPFFMDVSDVYVQLQQLGSLEISAAKAGSMLKQDLQCHICHNPLKNMPVLKNHIKACRQISSDHLQVL